VSRQFEDVVAARAASEKGENMAVPTLEDVVDKLKELSEVDEIDPDTLVSELEVDSLDVLELLYAIADEQDVEFDEDVLADLEDVTIRKIYGRVIEPILAAPATR
jgi:acyl carrier protein